MRKKYIYKPMNPGGRLPKIAGGTLAMDVFPTEEGFARLQRRLRTIEHLRAQVAESGFRQTEAR